MCFSLSLSPAVSIIDSKRFHARGKRRRTLYILHKPRYFGKTGHVSDRPGVVEGGEGCALRPHVETTQLLALENRGHSCMHSGQCKTNCTMSNSMGNVRQYSADVPPNKTFTVHLTLYSTHIRRCNLYINDFWPLLSCVTFWQNYNCVYRFAQQYFYLSITVTRCVIQPRGYERSVLRESSIVRNAMGDVVGAHITYMRMLQGVWNALSNPPPFERDTAPVYIYTHVRRWASHSV